MHFLWAEARDGWTQMPTLFSAHLPSLPQQVARVLTLLDLLQIIIRCQHIFRSEHEFRYQLPYLPISIPLTRKLAVSIVGLFSIQRGELLKTFMYLKHRFLSCVAAQAEKFSPASISCANRILVSHSILESLFADPDVSQKTHVPMISL